MIELKRASRWYGQVIGINDVTCEVRPGVTALLGPNGAGKSTFIKLVSGQLRPTTGTVRVFGMAPFANRSVLARLGYCPESESCYDDMTGRQFVTLLAALSGIPSGVRAQRVQHALDVVGIAQVADRRIAGYSKGMRQRVKFAQAIVHNPELIVLDEPLNGLDPIGRREMTELIVRLGEQGKCVLVSSHILYEVENMTRTILLMYRGRMLAQGDIGLIRAKIDEHPHRVAIDCNDARRLAQRLIEKPYVLSAKFDEARPQALEVETRKPDRFYAEFPDIILSDGFVVTRFESPDNNLEAVFHYLVG